MKHILSMLTLIFSLSAFTQNNITVEQIKKEYNNAINDTSQLKRKVSSSIIEPGVLDTVKVFYHDNQVRYIYYHRYIGGLTSVDDHFFIELFYKEGKLVFVRTLLKWDYYDKGFTPESKSKVEEQLGYLDLNGECLKYYEEREATGTRVTVMEELQKIPLEEKDCMYCSYDGNEGEKYLQKLK
jgi:hypothetical protein